MAIVFRAPLISLLLLTGCAAQSCWQFRHISTGDPLYDSKRLCYISKDAHSALGFEFFSLQDQIQALVYLKRSRFSENSQILFTIDGVCHESSPQIHEGGMRIKLDEETTRKLIQALQEGLSVGILIDGFEEKLDPKGFYLP